MIKRKKEVLTMVIVLILIIISSLPVPVQAANSNDIITNMNPGLKIFGLSLFLIGMGLILFKKKRRINRIGVLFVICAIVTLVVATIIA